MRNTPGNTTDINIEACGNNFEKVQIVRGKECINIVSKTSL